MALPNVPLRDRVVLAFLLWVFCEAVAFGAVVSAIGVGGAIGVGLLTSLLGATLAKRVGRTALGQLRRGVGASGGIRNGLPVEGALAGVSAILLLLPGFLTDGLGLVLAIPPLRAIIARRIQRSRLQGGARPHGPTTIDLDPQEWRPADDIRRAVRKP